jgi:protein-tyrosine-phosphatase/predicted ATP-grasp superfamily ATP-dependent carboligase
MTSGGASQRFSGGRALVLGDDGRACLTVVRSLGRRGVEVILGHQDPEALARWSRHVAWAVALPPTDRRKESWKQHVKGLLDRERFDAVIPTTDTALIPLMELASESALTVPLAIPSKEAFNFSHRKAETIRLAQTLGVPVPPTRIVETEAELDRVRRDGALTFPLIVKSSSSVVWKNGVRWDLSVKRARTRDELWATAMERLLFGPVLIQEFVPGIGVGQEFLVRDGRILSAFQHQRVHEPPGGGGSSYRKSVPLHPRMLSCSERLLARMGWNGVAMVEYRWDPSTDQFALMEVNGRFWGSLPLAVASGVDFPHRLFELLVRDREPESTAMLEGVYCRNVFKDLDWWRQRRRARGQLSFEDPGDRIVPLIRRILAGKERTDTFQADDPVPGLAEVFDLASRGMKNLGDRLSARWNRRRFGPAWRARQRSRARERIANNPRVLFVCRGNICRSPFAEMVARAAGRGVPALQFDSVGTIPIDGRVSPPEAVDAARAHGVDLERHRSRRVSAEHMSAAGLIIVMDQRTLTELAAEFPEAEAKGVFLGAFSTSGTDAEIADPWGRPADEFKTCYERIADSVRGLLEVGAS